MYIFVILSILIVEVNKDLTQTVEFLVLIWMFASELGHLGLSALSVEGNSSQPESGSLQWSGFPH